MKKGNPSSRCDIFNKIAREEFISIKELVL